MAILATGNTFATNNQVTAAKLNNSTNNATFASGSVDGSTTQLNGSGQVIVKDAGVSPAKLSAGAPTWDSSGNVIVSNNITADEVFVGTADTEAGQVTVYGAGAGSQEGGEISLHTAADHDGTYNNWSIDAYNTTLRCFNNVNIAWTITGPGAIAFNDNVTIAGDTIIATKTPASATATGTAGTIAWDANYIYTCVASNTWKRVAIASW